MAGCIDLIRKRRSVRTFNNERLSDEDQGKIKEYAKTANNPYGIDFEWFFLDSKKEDLSVPVIVGCDTYITGKAKKCEHLEEAFGYSLEKIVLYATSLGIGTTWIAGTMDRKGFEKAIGLKDEEVMPCISPLGYPAEKMSFREAMMRKGAKADERKNYAEIFFDEGFNKPLLIDDEMKDVFEAVRLAPSAINRQPWRIIKQGNSYHFYKKQGIKIDPDFDMQKIDMGIAMCHFDMLLKEKEINSRFLIEDPKTYVPEGIKYIATYTI